MDLNQINKTNQAGAIYSKTLTGLILRSKNGDFWTNDFFFFSDDIGVRKEIDLALLLPTMLFSRPMRPEEGGRRAKGN